MRKSDDTGTSSLSWSKAPAHSTYPSPTPPTPRPGVPRGLVLLFWCRAGVSARLRSPRPCGSLLDGAGVPSSRHDLAGATHGRHTRGRGEHGPGRILAGFPRPYGRLHQPAPGPGRPHRRGRHRSPPQSRRPPRAVTRTHPADTLALTRDNTGQVSQELSSGTSQA